MTDDNQADVQALPPSEFDVRAGKHAGATNRLMEMFGRKPRVTAETASSQIHGAIRSLEVLHVVDGDSPALSRASMALHHALAFVAIHKADRATTDAAVLKDMFFPEAAPDEEADAIATAAAALGA